MCLLTVVNSEMLQIKKWGPLLYLTVTVSLLPSMQQYFHVHVVFFGIQEATFTHRIDHIGYF